MKQKPPRNDYRTPEQIREHYEVEKELASRLRNASKQERRFLYSSLYDELYRRVPFHPQITRKMSSVESKQAVSHQMEFLGPFLSKDITFLELGPGDCALSFEVAKLVKQVYAVYVSDEITKATTAPANFQLILSDGSSVPIPPNSVNVAYSNMLIEHLHPADAIEQLISIYNALIPGGVYICITPNRITGPHDVSKYFDVAAMGFHLKEYTTLELCNLFRKAGFSRVGFYIGVRGKYLRLHIFPIAMVEMIIDKLLYILRRTIAPNLSFTLLPGIRLVGVK